MALHKRTVTSSASPIVKTLNLEPDDFDYDIDAFKSEMFGHRNMSGVRYGCTPRISSGSKYKGVAIHKKPQRNFWRARISYKGKTASLGCFPFTSEGEKAAARAYDKAALKWFGDYALTNQQYFGDL